MLGAEPAGQGSAYGHLSPLTAAAERSAPRSAHGMQLVRPAHPAYRLAGPGMPTARKRHPFSTETLTYPSALSWLGSRSQARYRPQNASWTTSSAANRSPSMRKASLVRPSACSRYNAVTASVASAARASASGPSCECVTAALSRSGWYAAEAACGPATSPSTSQKRRCTPQGCSGPSFPRHPGGGNRKRPEPGRFNQAIAQRRTYAGSAGRRRRAPQGSAQVARHHQAPAGPIGKPSAMMVRSWLTGTG
jgi:hypothetical protein